MVEIFDREVFVDLIWLLCPIMILAAFLFFCWGGWGEGWGGWGGGWGGEGGGGLGGGGLREREGGNWVLVVERLLYLFILFFGEVLCGGFEMVMVLVLGIWDGKL